MSNLTYYLFTLWFILLPFTIITLLYFGITAIDKLLAPVLILIWFLLYAFGKYSLNQNKIGILLLALMFFLFRNLSFMDNTSVFISAIQKDAMFFGYFALPILYINNLNKVKTAYKLISINAIVGCVSAFLVAIGLLSLPYERFSESRIGLDIQKAIGLFTSYGDLAQYAACFIVMATFAPSTLISGKSKKKLLVVSAFVIVIMGLIGNQSRSYLLSLLIALLMSALFYYRSKNKINPMLFKMMMGGSAIFFSAVITFLYSDIINLLSGLGGSQAQGTAEGRLGQYQLAFSLIRDYPILGVDSAFFAKYSEYIHGIHNMWLGQLSRGGIISTLMLASLFFIIFKTSLRLLYNHKTTELAIMPIGYTFATLVSTMFYPADSYLFWALLGMNAAVVTTLKSVKWSA